MPSHFCFPAALIYAGSLLFGALGVAQDMDPSSGLRAGSPIATTNGAPATPVDPSTQAMAQAIGLMNKNDVDGALAKLSQSIQLNPKNPAPYVLRASVYCQEKQWADAETDFKTAASIAPNNIVLKFNIVEVKFMQKQYDAARPGFAALEKDPDMGDFASYKVFLCDLAGGHEATAAKELDAFNQAASNPSYYFGNAGWDINHKKFDDARSWLESASHIYPPRKNQYYAESLIYLGYLPLPRKPGDTNADSMSQ